MAGAAIKYKDKIINGAIIILAVVIAGNIYSRQAKGLELLKEKNKVELKKNGLLEGISRLEKRMMSYKAILPKKEAGSIIDALSAIAKESGVKILSIRPAKEERQPEYIKLPFVLALSSPDYNAVGRFVSKIEGQKDVYLIESLGIRAEAEKTGKQELNVDLTLSAVMFSAL